MGGIEGLRSAVGALARNWRSPVWFALAAAVVSCGPVGCGGGDGTDGGPGATAGSGGAAGSAGEGGGASGGGAGSVDASAENAGGDASVAPDAPDSSPDSASDAVDGSTLPVDCPSGRGPAMVRAAFNWYPKGPVTYDFCIDGTKVTQAQYKQFLDANPSPPAQPAYCAWNTDLKPADQNFIPGCYQSYDPAKHPDWPVTCVDWCDAAAYCAWSGKRLCGAVGGGHFVLTKGVVTPGLDDANNNEWYAVCSEAGRQHFPYGSSFVEQCSPWYYEYDESNPNPWNTLTDVGTNTTCAGPILGVWDMTSQYPEWTDACAAYAGDADLCLIRPGFSNKHTYSSSKIDGWPCDAKGELAPTPTVYRNLPLAAVRCCADVAPLPGG